MVLKDYYNGLYFVDFFSSSFFQVFNINLQIMLKLMMQYYDLKTSYRLRPLGHASFDRPDIRDKSFSGEKQICRKFLCMIWRYVTMLYLWVSTLIKYFIIDVLNIDRWQHFLFGWHSPPPSPGISNSFHPTEAKLLPIIQPRRD